MNEIASGPNGNKSDDSGESSFDKAMTDRLRGHISNTPLDSKSKQLIDDLDPWLPALYFALAKLTSQPSTEIHTDSTESYALKDDPVAMFLGLIPEPTLVMDCYKLARARKAAHLDLGQFLDKLRSRGWKIDTAEGLRWEITNTNPPPSLLTAIAQELGIQEKELLTNLPIRSDLENILSDERLEKFIAEWAAEVNVSSARVVDNIKRAFAGASLRNGTEGSVDTMFEVLRTLRSIPGFLEEE